MASSRPSSLFRNRWTTLLWAIGICLLASEIVDGISGVTERDEGAQTASVANESQAQPVATPAAPYNSAATVAPPIPVRQDIAL